MIDPEIAAHKFYMTLSEAKRRSPLNSAYAPADVIGGWVYASGEVITNGFERWDGDPSTLKWRPVGKPESWLE